MSFEEDAEIYLLGSGIFSFLDLTVLTQHILSTKCKAVYYIHDLPSLEKFLKKLVPEAVNLRPIYYLEGRLRDEIYRDIVNHVINTEKEKRPIGLLLHGHPLVFSTISQLLIKECENQNISLAIHPGVSALDRLFVDLKLDIGRDGVQIFNAAFAIQKKINLNPAAGCFLFQIGSLNPWATRTETAKPEEIRSLKDYLLKIYPENHQVKIVESAVEIGFSSRIIEIPLKDLDQAHLAFDYNASLYIPPR